MNGSILPSDCFPAELFQDYELAEFTHTSFTAGQDWQSAVTNLPSVALTNLQGPHTAVLGDSSKVKKLSKNINITSNR